MSGDGKNSSYSIFGPFHNFFTSYVKHFRSLFAEGVFSIHFETDVAIRQDNHSNLIA